MNRTPSPKNGVAALSPKSTIPKMETTEGLQIKLVESIISELYSSFND